MVIFYSEEELGAGRGGRYTNYFYLAVAVNSAEGQALKVARPWLSTDVTTRVAARHDIILHRIEQRRPSGRLLFPVQDIWDWR